MPAEEINHVDIDLLADQTGSWTLSVDGCQEEQVLWKHEATTTGNDQTTETKNRDSEQWISSPYQWQISK